MRKVISGLSRLPHDAIMSLVTTFDGVSLKKIALPVEHGGWGIVLEPAVLGLAVVPAAAGIPIALAALLAFLARQPLKLSLNDLRKGKVYPRTRPAIFFALAYGVGATVMLAAAIALSGWNLLVPFALALPFGLIQLFHDARNDSRQWVAETAGSVAMGSVASSIAIAGGAGAALAFTLWLLMLCRSIPAVMYVRARLRLERGGRPATAAVLAVHVLALAASAVLHPLAALAMVVLLARAAIGLSSWRKSARPHRIGYAEIGYGILTVVLIALGYTVLR